MRQSSPYLGYFSVRISDTTFLVFKKKSSSFLNLLIYLLSCILGCFHRQAPLFHIVRTLPMISRLNAEVLSLERGRSFGKKETPAQMFIF